MNILLVGGGGREHALAWLRKPGVSAIIQPGGSIHDGAVVSAANEHDIAMVFMGVRHFLH